MVNHGFGAAPCLDYMPRYIYIYAKMAIGKTGQIVVKVLVAVLFAMLMVIVYFKYVAVFKWTPNHDGDLSMYADPTTYKMSQVACSAACKNDPQNCDNYSYNSNSNECLGYKTNDTYDSGDAFIQNEGGDVGWGKRNFTWF